VAGLAARTSGSFGEVLRSFRMAACMTQEEVAHRAGLSARGVGDMERGRTARPFSTSVRLLAKALDLDETARAQLIAAAYGEPEGGEDPWPGGGADSPQLRPLVPRQLPAAVQHFTGRSAELRKLTGLMRHFGPGRASAVSVIDGPAGVGKTALVVHWAHQVAERFPDGQLYVNLRGHDPAGAPASPGEALRGFLDAFGIPPAQIPVTLDAQAALYRTLLAGRRMLVIADNASDEQQVRPLLPGDGTNMVVVTSRSQLTGLAAVEGADRLCLKVFSEAEACQLLTSRLGTARLAGEQQATAELIDMCARLPLALSIAGARAAHADMFPSALVSELHEARNLLDAFSDSDSMASIRAVFSWSYDNLAGPAARMFRLLSVHPGPDISAQAAASLAGVTVAQARSLLDELAHANLLAEPVPGRFAFHDLLRAYAGELAARHEAGTEHAAARRRVLDHYLHTAHRAALQLTPSRGPISLAPLAARTRPEQIEGPEQALDWFTGEHLVLLAVLGLADAAKSDVHTGQLLWAMEVFLDWQGLAATSAPRSPRLRGSATWSAQHAVSSGPTRQAKAQSGHRETASISAAERRVLGA